MALTAAIGRELDGKIRVVNTRSLLGEGKFYWAEAFHCEGDKGQGVAQLAGVYGIARRDIVALGDNYNDLGMFAAAGVSVAMGNSPSEVKAAAQHLTGHVAEGGAAAILQDIAAGRFPGNQAGGAQS
jgi:hydroxymethylpyrimidine pyrophosphatase-like HAD family hydrolase